MLQADSLLELLQRFMHLEVKERQVRADHGARTVRKETMIFPRYRRLDAVRKLVAHARANGSGRNYLIQHSAGSGKSNSIAWLAHRLASLHDERDEKVFHSVIVVTDRRVLDQQLQATIYQFEHKTGVVEKIDEDTRQLVRALSQGTPIVITTIQKFPFISQALSTLEKKGSGVRIDTAGRRFAVIVDEAHSSQSGETAKALRGMLNQEGIEAAVAAQLSEEEDDDLSEEVKAAVLRDALRRARQPNLSFFAFTATPKFRTRALFDEPGPSGASPFHEYSMRQAIEEGFIMDVLQNYTTYRRFFGLLKQVEDDPEVPRRQAAKALTQYLELHPVTIEQVVSVIVEHFRLHVMNELGRRAKAMVVTGSRLAAVKYKLAFDDYIADQRYTGIRSLVAFSGTVEDPDDPGSSWTEVAMNDGLPETGLPEAFERDDYRVLLVAEKYQTGFDQPLLQTMYVVKRLAGVQDEERREEFRGQLKAYRNLYAFLSQIIPYQDSDLERLYAFVRNLLSKLPPPGDGKAFVLDDEVALQFFRLQQLNEGSIDLADGEADPLKGPTDVGTGQIRDAEVTLSSLVGRLNERFGTTFTDADQLFFDQIRASAENDERVAEAALANNLTSFSSFLDRVLDGLFIARMEGNKEIFTRVMTDAEFRSAAREHLAFDIFRRVRDRQAAV